MTELFKLSDGNEVSLPLVCDEALACFLAFPARVDSLPRLPGVLKHLGVGGRTICALLIADYRSMSIGPYREMVVMAPVKYKGEARPPVTRGVFVHEIAVTSEVSRLTGIEVWGFPKYLADINIDQKPGGINVKMQSLKTAFRASLPGWGIPLPASAPLPVFTVRESRLLLSYIKMKGLMHLSPPAAAKISVESGDSALSFLGGSKRAFASGFMKVKRATLGSAVFETEAVM
jgi:hypothetical protein